MCQTLILKDYDLLIETYVHISLSVSLFVSFSVSFVTVTKINWSFINFPLLLSKYIQQQLFVAENGEVGDSAQLIFKPQLNPWSVNKIKPTAQGDVDSGWREGSRPSLRATVNIPG